MDGYPRYDRNFRDLEQPLGDVLIHANSGAENSGADKWQTGQVQ